MKKYNHTNKVFTFGIGAASNKPANNKRIHELAKVGDGYACDINEYKPNLNKFFKPKTLKKLLLNSITAASQQEIFKDLSICIYIQKDYDFIDKPIKCVNETVVNLPKALIEGAINYVYFKVDFDFTSVNNLYVYAALYHGANQIVYSNNILTESTETTLTMAAKPNKAELELITINSGLLSKIYAKRMITKYTEQLDSMSFRGDKNEIRDKLIELSVKSNVMSKYTAMIVKGSKTVKPVGLEIKRIEIDKPTTTKILGTDSAINKYTVDVNAVKGLVGNRPRIKFHSYTRWLYSRQSLYGPQD